MTGFDGQVAVVTGAASGIGAALVRALMAKGAEVVALDRDAEGLRELGPAVDQVAVDVGDASSFEAAIDAVIERHGRIDLFINNAGIVVGGDFELTDLSSWERVVDVNMWGVIHGTRAAYLHMRTQRSGHIVNVASTAGVMPVARSVAYATTKHAVVGLTASLRAEARGTGVDVSVVIPGVVDTAIFGRAINVGGYDYARAMERVPFTRVSPDRAAAYILDGVSRRRAVITFPAYNRMLVGLHRMAPALTSQLVNR
ncbi:short-chain dehydrogenase [Nocardioides baekrokdamisoli]|uniref:Short-chain dehydrogenase n=1 Tax=Nocardioides baekrokdamisoli TaxID=1804624 RepID=A0A3G9II82_9ACTN|nr:SDR family oxidoreductase [Nocardioides baekrokdamisoli]BBH18056.1 short-chain dehydrogenase [Nocardioides baekrokdamisoli]